VIFAPFSISGISNVAESGHRATLWKKNLNGVVQKHNSFIFAGQLINPKQ